MTPMMSEEDTDILILDNFIISYVVDSNIMLRLPATDQYIQIVIIDEYVRRYLAIGIL